MTEIVLQEQLLECAICMERLDENCKMLPCQHTYCKTCLEKTFEHEGSLSCPQCRKIVSNITSRDLIDTLPTNLMLLNLIELVKRNPPRPQNEDEELETAIMNSIEDFQKEKAADILLKHNEQLQTRLAIESSKRDILLKSAQDMKKEKLEVEVATLKSEREVSMMNPDYVADLISWFETSHAEFTQESKKEALIALKSLRLAKVTQRNGSIQRRIRTLLENLKAPATKMENKDDVVASASYKDDMIENINKKLEEVKVLLRNEIQSKELNAKTEKNYLSKSHQFHPPKNSQKPHLPVPPLHPAHQKLFSHYYDFPPRPVGFMSTVYQQPYYGPPRYSSSYFPTYRIYPPSAPFGPVPFSHSVDSQQNHGKTSNHGSPGDKRGKGGHHSSASSTDFKNFKKSSNPKFADRNDLHLSKCLILPDVRDYDRIGKKMSNLSLRNDGDPLQKSDKKIRENVYQLPASRIGHDGAKNKNFKDTDFLENIRGRFRRGRGKNWYRDASKSDANTDGFESDSSVNSMTSVSSKLSTCSTPAVFYEKKRFSLHRGKNRGSHNRNFQRKSRNDDGPPKEIPSENNSDKLKKVIYPSKEEAHAQNLDVNKPFATPLVCLGKNGTDRVSVTVECLADIYAFEGKYSDCKLIRF